VKIGYARPKDERGRHPSGLVEVMVWRPQDLTGLDSKTQAVRIAHTVGENKRIQILDQAKKASIRVLNPGVKKEAVPAVAPEAAEAAPEIEVVEPTVEEAVEKPAAPTEEPEKETETPKTETAKEPAKKERKRKGKSGKKKEDKK